MIHIVLGNPLLGSIDFNDMLFAAAEGKQQVIDKGIGNMDEQTPGNSTGGFDLNKSTIISLLYLGSFITGLSGFIGIVLAFVWKGEVADTWEESHLQYHIMTFVVGFVASIIAALLMLVLIGFLLFPIIALWVIARAVVALLKAQKQEPMPDPKTLLF
ncbi:MAG: hypothetical protein Pars2KO_12150 [Parasphingorhabdus sp.]